jgi:dTDP-4-dehydrorhamnose 3,5-epimerase
MKFTGSEIKGLFLIEPVVNYDSRGYFFESFKEKEFELNIGKINFIQDNESKSSKGVLRGLHYQIPPFAQSKLVRVVEGSILDIAVDIRNGSPTFGKYESFELNSDNKHQLFIPRGFAHGFLALSEYAVIQYKVDNYYSKESERGIIYNDSVLGIDWQMDEKMLLVSEKDTILPFLKNAELFDFYSNLY